jgi:hypothetical protein
MYAGWVLCVTLLTSSPTTEPAGRPDRLRLLLYYGIAPRGSRLRALRREKQPFPVHEDWNSLLKAAGQACLADRRLHGPARGVQIEAVRFYTLFTGIEVHEQLNERFGVEDADAVPAPWRDGLRSLGGSARARVRQSRQGAHALRGAEGARCRTALAPAQGGAGGDDCGGAEGVGEPRSTGNLALGGKRCARQGAGGGSSSAGGAECCTQRPLWPDCRVRTVFPRPRCLNSAKATSKLRPG